MSDQKNDAPFRVLGEKLRLIRQKLRESVADAAGAVEIDEQALQKIEQGTERPSEDILMLLINHFGMRDDDADRLWHLAGYDQPHSHDDDHDSHDHSQQNRAMVMIMAVDPRVIYTDGVHITANSSGVVLSFTQGAGTPHALTTSRVGMSREQALRLARMLQQTLEQSKPRQLPAPQKPTDIARENLPDKPSDAKTDSPKS